MCGFRQLRPIDIETPRDVEIDLKTVKIQSLDQDHVKNWDFRAVFLNQGSAEPQGFVVTLKGFCNQTNWESLSPLFEIFQWYFTILYFFTWVVEVM
jgi:hypothetical protein